MRFTKMHGAGNDYVYVNGYAERVEDPPALARAVSRPHFGIGADGLILVLPSKVADFRMRIFNADGSEATMCGNGARCVGRFVHDKGLTDRTRFTLETGGGVRDIALELDDKGGVASVTVDMGVAREVRDEPDGATYVDTGNPHRVYRVAEDPFLWDDFAARARPLCEATDANIEYALPVGDGRVRMRVYERGSGETMACGSGACATAVAIARAGLCGPDAIIEMRGGEVRVAQRPDGHILMTGEAVAVFEGDWPV